MSRGDVAASEEASRSEYTGLKCCWFLICCGQDRGYRVPSRCDCAEYAKSVVGVSPVGGVKLLFPSIH